MIERLESSGGNVIGFTMPGRLHDEDYKVFTPAVEEAFRHRYGDVA